jgi:hypothetical protein
MLCLIVMLYNFMSPECGLNMAKICLIIFSDGCAINTYTNRSELSNEINYSFSLHMILQEKDTRRNLCQVGIAFVLTHSPHSVHKMTACMEEYTTFVMVTSFDLMIQSYDPSVQECSTLSAAPSYGAVDLYCIKETLRTRDL